MCEIEINLISRRAYSNLMSTDTGVNLNVILMFQFVVLVFLILLIFYLAGDLKIPKNIIVIYDVICVFLVLSSIYFTFLIFYKLYDIHYKRAIQIEHGYESDSSVSVNSNV